MRGYVIEISFTRRGLGVGQSFSRRERSNGSRLAADDFREWIEDWVGVTRSHRYTDCVAALEEAGFLLPPSGGWEQLEKVFNAVQVQVLDNRPYGMPRRR